MTRYVARRQTDAKGRIHPSGGGGRAAFELDMRVTESTGAPRIGKRDTGRKNRRAEARLEPPRRFFNQISDHSEDSKYPTTSTMKCNAPEVAARALKVVVPSDARETIALLARIWPAAKLIELVGGGAVSPA